MMKLTESEFLSVATKRFAERTALSEAAAADYARTALDVLLDSEGAYDQTTRTITPIKYGDECSYGNWDADMANTMVDDELAYWEDDGDD